MKNKIIVNKTIIVFLIFFLIGINFFPSAIGKKIDENENILYVGGVGPGNYSSIKAAIENCSSGDTVFVFNGTYFEHDLVLDKSIKLVGENRESTIIDGEKKGSILKILADDCLVSGFTLIHCKTPGIDFLYGVLQVFSDNNIIKNNIFSFADDKNGDMATIELRNSSHNSILDNIIYEDIYKSCRRGVLLRGTSTNNLISGNEIYGYTIGVLLKMLGDEGEGNVFSDNYIHDNGGGFKIFCDNVEIIDNQINHNKLDGLDIGGAGHVISGNIIKDNGWWSPSEWEGGIMMKADESLVSNNHIVDNNPTGIYCLSYGTIIENNNFINNGNNCSKTDKYVGNAYFYYNGLKEILNSNKWKNNYWDDPLQHGLKIVEGDVEIFMIGFAGFSIPWWNIDWNPAKQPYDI